MKRWQQLLSFYLVLCVAFAGAVGISPVLHVMLEHGGEGHAHSHAGFQNGGNIAGEHAHPHPHIEAPSSSDDALVRLLAEKCPPSKLFGVTLEDVYRAIGDWIAQAFEHLPGTPDGEGTGHTHHSLSQMLLGGTVEGVLDVPPLVFAPTAIAFSPSSSSASFVASEFEAQTASRAPPACA